MDVYVAAERVEEEVAEEGRARTKMQRGGSGDRK